MLIATRPQPSTAVATVALPLTSVAVDIDTVIHSVASVRELLNEAGLLVADLGLVDAAAWADASAGVAATAATLRTALIDLTGATGPLDVTEPVDAVPVAVTAAPVVRAREIGFLTSRLAAVVDEVSEHDHVHVIMRGVGDRLEEDLRALRRPVEVDAASTPRRRRTARIWRRR